MLSELIISISLELLLLECVFTSPFFEMRSGLAPLFLGSESSSVISVLSCQEGMLGEDNVVRLCPGNERLQINLISNLLKQHHFSRCLVSFKWISSIKWVVRRMYVKWTATLHLCQFSKLVSLKITCSEGFPSLIEFPISAPAFQTNHLRWPSKNWYSITTRREVCLILIWFESDLLQLLSDQIQFVRKPANAGVKCSHWAFVGLHCGQKNIAGLHENFVWTLFSLKWPKQPLLNIFLILINREMNKWINFCYSGLTFHKYLAP